MDVKNRKAKDGRPASFPAPKLSSTPPPKQSPAPSEASKRRIVLKRPTKKTLIIAGVVLAICSVLTMFFIGSLGSTSKADDAPGYRAILPEGKSISSLGGWQRVSPPAKDPVYAYNDKIDGTKISISQQPLPESFKGSVPAKLSELAKSYNATNKLQAGDTTVYLGVSSKGPQSVIFTKEGLLVLVKSEKKVADSAWSAYVTSLSSSNLDSLPKY